LPDPVRSVFRVSHPLDGLLLPLPPGPVSCRNAHGVPPSRGFPSQGAAHSHRTGTALLAFFPAHCLRPWSEGGGRPLPRHLEFREGPFTRLQGFALPKSPFAPENTIRHLRRPIPSWAFSSPGSTLLHRCNGFRRRSSLVLQPAYLPGASSRSFRRPAPQSFSPRRSRLPTEVGSQPS
jgi:hypothetical protein